MIFPKIEVSIEAVWDVSQRDKYCLKTVWNSYRDGEVHDVTLLVDPQEINALLYEISVLDYLTSFYKNIFSSLHIYLAQHPQQRFLNWARQRYFHPRGVLSVNTTYIDSAGVERRTNFSPLYLEEAKTFFINTPRILELVQSYSRLQGQAQGQGIMFELLSVCKTHSDIIYERDKMHLTLSPGQPSPENLQLTGGAKL